MNIFVFGIVVLVVVQCSQAAVTANKNKEQEKSAASHKTDTALKASTDPFHHVPHKIQASSAKEAPKQSDNFRPPTKFIQDYVPSTQNVRLSSGPRRHKQHPRQQYLPAEDYEHVPEQSQNYGTVPQQQQYSSKNNKAKQQHRQYLPAQDYEQPDPQKQYLSLEPIRTPAAKESAPHQPEYHPQRLSPKQSAQRRHFDAGHHDFNPNFEYERQPYRRPAYQGDYDRPNSQTFFQDHQEPDYEGNEGHKPSASSNNDHSHGGNEGGYEQPKKGCKLVEKEIKDLPEELTGGQNKNKGFSSKRYMMVKECFYEDDGPRGSSQRPSGGGTSESKSSPRVHSPQPYEYKFDQDDFFKDFLSSDYSTDHYTYEPYNF